MDRVLLLSLLVLLLSEDTVALCNDSQPGGESIQQQLEDALLSDPCNLNQLETRFPIGDLPPLTCVPVNYTIQLQQENNTESSDTNATLTYQYLWTTFDATKKIPGNFLLIWSFRGTFVLGFDWEDSCKFSETDTIFLYLDGTNIDLTNKTERVISKALKNITLKLKTYAETGGNSSQSNGYAREWSKDIIRGYHHIVTGIETGIFILCVLMVISFGPDLFDLKVRIQQDTVRYIWRSFLFLAFSWTWIVHPILVGINGYRLIIYIITFANIFYLIVASCIYGSKRKDRFKCTRKDFLGNFDFKQIAAFAITLSFLTHMFFAFPSVALGFYAFPSRTLIRLSYFELALLCLFVGVAFLFKQADAICTCTCIKSRDCNITCTTDRALLPPVGERQPLLPPVGERQPLLPRDGERQPLPPPAEGTPVHTRTTSVRPSVCSMCHAGLRVVTVVMLLVFLSTLLIVVGGIVFEGTSDADHSINDYLYILPTIGVNIILLAIHPKGLRNMIKKLFFGAETPASPNPDTPQNPDRPTPQNRNPSS